MPDASGDEVLPEHAIFRFELIGEFPQQLFYPAEDLVRQTDGINASDIHGGSLFIALVEISGSRSKTRQR
jgi:hypothetical protein